MANPVVPQAIQTVQNIMDAAVKKFRGSNMDGDKIRKTFNTLLDDLTLHGNAPTMKHQSVRHAMNNLKDALMGTETTAKKRQSTIEDFVANLLDITDKLDQLTKGITEQMLPAVLDSIINGTKLMDSDIAAVYAFHGPRRQLTRLATQLLGNSTDDAINSTSGDGTELEKFTSWSQLRTQTELSNRQVIADGTSSSIIYQGTFKNMVVAIKIFRKCDAEVKARFLSELGIVQKLQHPNIVKLLGHYFEYTENLKQLESHNVQVDGHGGFGFISEYQFKRSIVEVIHSDKEHVDWPSLFEIIKGIAKGISYLHEEGVVHLDLKLENILLDDNMTPIINNFGKAKDLKSMHDQKGLFSVIGDAASRLCESYGYSNPFGKRKETEPDVCSFGVIVLETIGRMCYTSKKGPTDPKDWARRMERIIELKKLFDGKRVTDQEQRAEARRCVIVGLLCCLPDHAARRPSMMEVTDMLGP